MFGSGARPSDFAYDSFAYDKIISNEEMNDIMKIIKSLEECGLLIKGISETVKKGRISRNVIRHLKVLVY